MARLHQMLFGCAVLAAASFAAAQSATDTSGSSSTGSTTAASGDPSNNVATDPYIQRRMARKEAKAEYKEKKKEAKQEYKAEKKEADARLKESGTASGVQTNTDSVNNPSSGR